MTEPRGLIGGAAPIIAVGPIPIHWGTLMLLCLPPLLWAGNAVAGRLAAPQIGPLELNALRWVGALVLLSPFAAGNAYRLRGIIRGHLGGLFALAILGVGSFNSFQYWALRTSSPNNTTLIGSAGPVFILAVGALFFGERIRPRQVIGGVLSVAGVAWVMLRGDWDRLARVEFDPGDCYMLAATLTWSIYTWLLRKGRPPCRLRCCSTCRYFSALSFSCRLPSSRR